jgi:nitroimidazol reductase NimA-like FMN-containing flavoprotein (pyridoxamine 5'-phosphate oxidase superfamily)
MEIEAMSVEECRSLLARGNIARLACALNNQPYVIPVEIAFDGVALYGYSTLGQKIEWMRQNPLVCVEMDEIVSDRQWETVIVFGTYQELLPTEEDEGSRRSAERLFQRRPMWWEPASVPLAGQQAARPRVVFRIEPHGLTGRRTLRDVVNTTPFLPDASEPVRTPWLAHALRRLIGRR